MQAIYVFAAATLLAVLVAVGICFLFHRLLGVLLSEICGGEVRGRFWAMFGNACVVLTTLFAAICFVSINDKTAATPAALLQVFVSTLRGGLFGLLVTLGVLGIALALGIVGFNSRERRAAYLGREQPRATAG